MRLNADALPFAIRIVTISRRNMTYGIGRTQVSTFNGNLAASPEREVQIPIGPSYAIRRVVFSQCECAGATLRNLSLICLPRRLPMEEATQEEVRDAILQLEEEEDSDEIIIADQ